MAIRLHSFVITEKRYVQVESQPYHITGLLKRIINSANIRGCDFIDIHNAYYSCEEDGTVTFYQANRPEIECPGIWTYLLYECPKSQEKIFRDSKVSTSIEPLYKLLAGEKLIQETVNINQYLEYQYREGEYLDVMLPYSWDNLEGRKISQLILNEYTAFKSSKIFTEGVGKEYMGVVLEEFIQAGSEILESGGKLNEFESVQCGILKKIKIDEMANLILSYNDYRIWQTLLPSNSKAVEYAFDVALHQMSYIK
ncbi:hypothetical protein [Brunnivagina elsteri]|uniref:Uncharacterized protein n=1 Tax=Brunnivagina elsteri CCALA 953 TaxID=987040 RepID=A0A2A2TQB8_9CYAN|nr:hypothetical protein [Calothrix elsteri]PAX60632.1 hypothetical protein CK510_00830 [Calothrix elsteri CCALA 953]